MEYTNQTAFSFFVFFCCHCFVPCIVLNLFLFGTRYSKKVLFENITMFELRYVIFSTPRSSTYLPSLDGVSAANSSDALYQRYYVLRTDCPLWSWVEAIVLTDLLRAKKREMGAVFTKFHGCSHKAFPSVFLVIIHRLSCHRALVSNAAIWNEWGVSSVCNSFYFSNRPAAFFFLAGFYFFLWWRLVNLERLTFAFGTQERHTKSNGDGHI